MNLQFNKKTAQFLSVLYIALAIFGSSAYLFIVAGINNIVLSDLAVRNIILFNMIIRKDS